MESTSTSLRTLRTLKLKEWITSKLSTKSWNQFTEWTINWLYRRCRPTQERVACIWDWRPTLPLRKRELYWILTTKRWVCMALSSTLPLLRGNSDLRFSDTWQERQNQWLWVKHWNSTFWTDFNSKRAKALWKEPWGTLRLCWRIVTNFKELLLRIPNRKRCCSEWRLFRNSKEKSWAKWKRILWKTGTSFRRDGGSSSGNKQVLDLY